jgi:hypothetical protein
MDLHAIIAIISGVTTIGSTIFVLIRYIAKPIQRLDQARETDEKAIVRLQSDLANRIIVCDDRHKWDGRERRKSD